MVKVITSLRHFHLRIKSLDKLALIMKNWPNDPN